MTKVPTPRFDLLKMDRYAFGSLQFSAAAPFSASSAISSSPSDAARGSRPPPRCIAELDAIQKTGMEIAFIVDDNLIGNKKAIKEILREMINWQQRHATRSPFHRSVDRPGRR